MLFVVLCLNPRLFPQPLKPEMKRSSGFSATRRTRSRVRLPSLFFRFSAVPARFTTRKRIRRSPQQAFCDPHHRPGPSGISTVLLPGGDRVFQPWRTRDKFDHWRLAREVAAFGEESRPIRCLQTGGAGRGCHPCALTTLPKLRLRGVTPLKSFSAAVCSPRWHPSFIR